MSERYQCHLRDDLLKIAETELNEPTNNELRLAEIDKLKQRFLNEQEEHRLMRSDDGFLLRFLRVKKFNQGKAYAALLNYHRLRKEFPEIYAKADNTVQVARVFGSGALAALRHRAKDGSTVTIYRPGFIPADISLIEQIAAFLLFLERLLEEEDMQICGLTSITDFTGAGMNFVKQCTPYSMKCLFAVTTDCLPIRIKSVELFNEYAIFLLAYAIAKPFMKKKLQERLRLHGDNFTKLHTIVDANGLPSFLAGTGPEIDSNYWKTEVLSTLGRGELTGL